jgi:p-aminobenzoyl-glutamate transporter AbgT
MGRWTEAITQTKASMRGAVKWRDLGLVAVDHLGIATGDRSGIATGATSISAAAPKRILESPLTLDPRRL